MITEHRIGAWRFSKAPSEVLPAEMEILGRGIYSSKRVLMGFLNIRGRKRLLEFLQLCSAPPPELDMHDKAHSPPMIFHPVP